MPPYLVGHRYSKHVYPKLWLSLYTPAYRKNAPLTIEHLPARLAELGPIHSYATEHDDVLVLDELLCQVVTIAAGAGGNSWSGW